MFISHKYRIYPNLIQQGLLTNIFGCIRLVYNIGLETKISTYRANKTNISAYSLMNQLPELKKEYVWLNVAPAVAYQQEMNHIDKAFKNFFKGKGFPKFKNKYSKQSFTIPAGIGRFRNTYIIGNQIQILKLGKIKIKLDKRLIAGKIKSVTISKTPTGKYYASVLIDDSKEIPTKAKTVNGTSIGIDLGIKDFAVTDNGTKYSTSNWIKIYENELRIQQRSLSRKKKNGKNYEKQKLVVAKIHERISNLRNNMLHQISAKITNSEMVNTIFLEDLAVQNMMKNRKLSKSISNAGWAEFRRQLIYKCERKGKNLVLINRFSPSSKRCSECGEINQSLTLKDRIWTCQCSVIHDRDINAAKNIKHFGLKQIQEQNDQALVDV